MISSQTEQRLLRENQMAKRDSGKSPLERIFVWSHAEYSAGQPRLEWINPPKEWSEDLGIERAYLPAGPLFDVQEGSEYGTGFAPFAETPVFVVDRPIGSKPLFDITGQHRDVFLVSERAKDVLERIDPDAFVFADVETRLANGDAGPRHWLGDVVRKLEAFDLQNSEGARVTQVAPFARFAISPLYDKNLFRRDVIGDAHFFRLKNSASGIYCDEVAKAEIYSAPKLKGIHCAAVGGLDA